MSERPSGAFRLPDQRSAETYAPPYGAPDPTTTSGSHALPPPEVTGARIPVRGPEYPTVRPTAPSSGIPASPETNLATEPTTAVPPLGERPRFPEESVYRTRRPVSAILIAIVTVLLLVPVVLLLIQVTFVDDPSVRGVVPSVLLTLGLPLTGGGLYSLAAGGPAGRDVWLRPPVAYLPVGLLLLLAAGLSVA